MKIHVVGSNYVYANWLEGKMVDSIDDADLVMLTGGEDWHSSWYSNEEPHPSMTTNFSRDLNEIREAVKAYSLKKKMIGICRGSQGGCIFAGGELIQHQDTLGYIPPMRTHDDRVIQVTSTHHQAAYPFRKLKEGEDFKLLGWTNSLKFRFLNAKESAHSSKEAEVVYYPKINFLGIQPHPESMYGIDEYNETITYFQNLAKKFIEGKL